MSEISHAVKENAVIFIIRIIKLQFSVSCLQDFCNSKLKFCCFFCIFHVLSLEKAFKPPKLGNSEIKDRFSIFFEFSS